MPPTVGGTGTCFRLRPADRSRTRDGPPFPDPVSRASTALPLVNVASGCCFIFLSSSLPPPVPLHLSLTTDGDRIVSTRPQSQTKGFDKISILQTTYVQVLNGMGHLHCYFDVSTTYRPAICPLCIMSYTLWSSDRPTVLKGALMTPRRKNSMASELSLRLPT